MLEATREELNGFGERLNRDENNLSVFIAEQDKENEYMKKSILANCQDIDKIFDLIHSMERLQWKAIGAISAVIVISQFVLAIYLKG